MSNNEDIKTGYSTSMDENGVTYARFQANGVVKQGALHVEHVNDNGVERSKITLDTNKDGVADYTFDDDGKLTRYFTSGDRAIALMEQAQGQHFTKDLGALKDVKPDIATYRAIADFVMSPSTQHLPHVGGSKDKQR